MVSLFVLSYIAWCVVGLTCHWYWWTSDWDYDLEALLIGICVMQAGPITWLIGSSIHNNNGYSNRFVFFKRRTK